MQGCIELLKRYKIAIAGKHAVVLGRSNIVGIPVAMLLLQENATVTVCHSHTPDIADVVSRVRGSAAAAGRSLTRTHTLPRVPHPPSLCRRTLWWLPLGAPTL